MKKLVLMGMLASFVAVSCSKKEETSTESQPESNVMLKEPESSEASTVALTPEEQGKQLVESADCLTCHKIDSKLIGPPYRDVAAKYTEADIDHLATKIIEGGKGVWGEVPMSPHPGLSPENAKLMVRFVLSQK